MPSDNPVNNKKDASDQNKDNQEKEQFKKPTETPQQEKADMEKLKEQDKAKEVPPSFGNLQLVDKKDNADGKKDNPGDKSNSGDSGDSSGTRALQHGGKEIRAGREAPDPYDPGAKELPKTTDSKGVKIKSTGNPSETNVKIEYGRDGKPHKVKDQHGHWESTDGGKTWNQGPPDFGTRKGDVSIDEKGNYNYENQNYGIKMKHAPDGTSKRSMTAGDGTEYSVTRDQKGMPTEFKDKGGEWSSKDGKNWENKETKEKKSGSPSVSEYGKFEFKPDSKEINNDKGNPKEKGDSTVAKSAQLERIHQMKDALSKRFGIKFAQPGEKDPMAGMGEGGQAEGSGDGKMPPMGKPLKDGEVDPQNDRRPGEPTESELKTLGGILEKTRHENYKDMKIWFMQRGGTEPGRMAEYAPKLPGDEGPGGNPAPGQEGHKHSGNCCGRGGEKGVEKHNGHLIVNPMARQMEGTNEAFERTGLHELAHHEQPNKFGKMGPHMLGKDSTPESRKMAEDMGWKWSEKSKAPAMEDKQGKLWVFKERKPGPDGRHGDSYWTPEGGKEPGKRISSEEMRDRAKVRPSSNYFDNPHETHAEALALYRIGERDQFKGGRRYLAQDSPQLYDATKKYDQKVLDSSFGKHLNGESKMIRSIDGTIVENTPEARRAVEERERLWRAGRR